MKTLRLSTIVLLLASVFFACTKDDSSLRTAEDASSSAAAKKVGLEVAALNGKEDVTLTITFSPEIGIKDEEVTVTGTFAEGSPVPDCGHLQLQQWVDGEWVNFGPQVDVTEAIHEVSHAFTPTEAGEDAYKFQLHYVASGGDGQGQCAFNQEMSDEFALDVTDPCPISAFGIEGKAVGVPVGDGMYEITVTYTLSSPEAMENVHFQGGATSGGQFKFEPIEMSPEMKFKNENKQNNVMYWEGSIGDCGTKTLYFKYKRKFSCPQDANSAVSGQWTLTGGGLAEPYIVAPVTYDCVSAPAQ